MAVQAAGQISAMNRPVLPSVEEQVGERLAAIGLVSMGWFAARASQLPDGFPGGDGGRPFAGLLIANAGPAMWHVFSRSPEAGDGHADPLNRWTERILGEVLGDLLDGRGAGLVFPFGVHRAPFQRWARAAAGMEHSPLGLLIHPQFGLWHAFRGALIFADQSLVDGMHGSLVGHAASAHPCDSCADRPCLTACPVDAFSAAGLNVKACYGWLDRNDSPQCMELGCRARDACPVGREYRYDDAQVRFHMASYRGIRGPTG